MTPLNPFFLSDGWASAWLETIGSGVASRRLDLPGAEPVTVAVRRREGFRQVRLAGGDIADYEELPLDGDPGGAQAAREGALRDARGDLFLLAHAPEGSATLAWARQSGATIFPRGGLPDRPGRPRRACAPERRPARDPTRDGL